MEIKMNKRILSVLTLLVIILSLTSLVSAQSQNQSRLSFNDDNQLLMSQNTNQSMLEITNRFREMNKELTNCTEKCYYQIQSDGNLSMITQNREVRFLGLKLTARESFQVNQEGQVLDNNNNFAEFLRRIGIARTI